MAGFPYNLIPGQSHLREKCRIDIDYPEVARIDHRNGVMHTVEDGFGEFPVTPRHLFGLLCTRNYCPCVAAETDKGKQHKEPHPKLPGVRGEHLMQK